MATSPSHRWGQIIGQEFLEVAIAPLMSAVAAKHGLYLDRKGTRAARTGRKISWVDLYGNTHDLDFVLERNGSDTQIGSPVAFVETAWRRYTKHSRNKAQEIQGAILPLVTTHQNHAPFIGVILAGDFTGGSLTQLTSLGFRVLYFPYDSIMAAFARAGIDARFDEDTPDAECLKKVQAWDALGQAERNKIAQHLLKSQKAQVNEFMQSLELAVTRTIKAVVVLPLHGAPFAWESVDAAIRFIEGYAEQDAAPKPVAKYEIQIRYNNGDSIRGEFVAKEGALTFLRSYQPPLRPQMRRRE
jgi:hypothetical protein